MKRVFISFTDPEDFYTFSEHKSQVFPSMSFQTRMDKSVGRYEYYVSNVCPTATVKEDFDLSSRQIRELNSKASTYGYTIRDAAGES